MGQIIRNHLQAIEVVTDVNDTNTDRSVRYALGAVGAAIGGIIGLFLFGWLVRQQFYALILPGAMLGVGCGMASRIRSRGLGLACAVAAIGLGIYAEWSSFPFKADESLGFFLRNLTNLKPITLILIVLGAVFAYSTGTGRHRPSRRPV